jgi:phosphoribosylaminoimidazole-succinocarboxamide synthase
VTKSVVSTDIREFPILTRGKVRDVYDMGNRLLIVATDRLSAFDWVLPTPIPGKGKILTAMSLFWFDFMKNIVPNHVLESRAYLYPEPLKKYALQLEGRSMIVRKAHRIDIECVARGYLVGSGYKDYIELTAQNPDASEVNLYGNMLKSSLRLAEKLPAPIFTPATKEESGHDRNISFAEMGGVVGADLAARLRDITLAVYTKAESYARGRGIIIADTKFEFGFVGDRLILIDEILSPDSSRLWPADTYAVGKNPPSFDKQFVRDWLEKSGWDKNSPPPELPNEIVRKTSEKYQQAYERLVG